MVTFLSLTCWHWWTSCVLNIFKYIWFSLLSYFFQFSLLCVSAPSLQRALKKLFAIFLLLLSEAITKAARMFSICCAGLFICLSLECFAVLLFFSLSSLLCRCHATMLRTLRIGASFYGGNTPGWWRAFSVHAQAFTWWPQTAAVN